MKKLMTVPLLAILASCGDSGTSNKIKPERFQDAALSVERGLVSIESTVGSEKEYHVDADGNYTVVNRPVKTDEYSVILKIDGTKIYKYVENRDLLNGTVEKSVEVEDVSAESLREALKLPGARLSGNIFTLNWSQDFTTELSDSAVLKSKFDNTYRLDLLDIHCSGTSSMREYDVRLTQNGVESRSGETRTVSTTKCEAALSSEKLKALDLRAITFCEDGASNEDETSCETRNMEFLTDDII